MFLPAKTVAQRNWTYGIFLGLVRRSNEYIVADASGAAIKTRSMKRLPADKRWDRQMMDALAGTPWAPLDGVHSQPIPVEVPPAKPAVGVEVPAPPQPGGPQIRRMKVPWCISDQHGDPGCKGCATNRRRR